jgi:hypothetical protein
VEEEEEEEEEEEKGDPQWNETFFHDYVRSSFGIPGTLALFVNLSPSRYSKRFEQCGKKNIGKENLNGFTVNAEHSATCTLDNATHFPGTGVECTETF